jgi:hypothetical protein
MFFEPVSIPHGIHRSCHMMPGLDESLFCPTPSLPASPTLLGHSVEQHKASSDNFSHPYQFTWTPEMLSGNRTRTYGMGEGSSDCPDETCSKWRAGIDVVTA